MFLGKREEDVVAVGQVWRKKPRFGVGITRIRVERLARNSVIGPLTISGIPLVANGQVKYSQLKAKWERETG